jgi:hypothetical protein
MSSKPGHCTTGCLRGIMAAVTLLASTYFVSADEMSAILGCSQVGVTCGTAQVDQIPGNISTIRQSGNSNTASVEQQAILGAYANAASIQQNGTGDNASLTQKGSQNAVGLAQNGNNQTASIGQNGTNLGLQINQYGNGTSIGVTQFGTGSPSAAPVTINTFK